MKYKIKSKGSTLVEFILVIPVMAVFLFVTWELFMLSKNRISLVNAVRFLAWEKVDYTGGTGGSDPRNTADIISEARSFYSLEDSCSLSLTDNDSVSGGAVDAAISFSVNCLGLNQNGLWEANASCDVPLGFADVLNDLFPGGDVVPSSIHLEEKCLLLTDAWNATDPDDSTTSGQVRERIKGYWLIGPLDFSGGEISGLISDILEFSIDIPILGTYYLCPEQPPRVNLKSVPDRFE